MHGVEPKEKSSYEDDLELEFTYKADELRRDRIWIHENLDEIIQLIRSTENKKDLKIKLKEIFGLSDFQIRKLLSVRLDMLSKEDYLADVEEETNKSQFISI
jgi:DNA gyrase/topoisomerase IV subunit A